MGYAYDARLQKTFRHLLRIQQPDGGRRRNKFSFGRGHETEYLNPYSTLTALNAFRFSDYLRKKTALDNAVEFLLRHWEIKQPIGPCHYEIGAFCKAGRSNRRKYKRFG